MKENAELLITSVPIEENVTLKSKADLSRSQYADDVVKLIVAAPNKQLQNLCSMQPFDKEVAKIGMAQNKDKMIVSVSLSGPGTRVAIRDLAAHPGKNPLTCSMATKSLGAIVTANASAGQ